MYICHLSHDLTYINVLLLCVCENQCCLLWIYYILWGWIFKEFISINFESMNPTWEPQFYLMDCSDAVITRAFPNTLREFHREQAWGERCVKERKHRLSENQGASILNLLRNHATALPNYDLYDKLPDYHFQNAVSQLKTADMWLKNQDVSNNYKKVVELSKGYITVHLI